MIQHMVQVYAGVRQDERSVGGLYYVLVLCASLLPSHTCSLNMLA